MIRMKALRQFRGRRDEGKNGLVKVGREFKVADQRRARDLEAGGLAVPLQAAAAGDTAPPVTAPTSKPLVNQAETEGPLSSDGGPTGEILTHQPELMDPAEAQLVSSSPVDPAPQPSTSELFGDDPASSPSTRAGGSRRGRTSSMPATADGGSTEPASPTSEG